MVLARGVRQVKCKAIIKQSQLIENIQRWNVVHITVALVIDSISEGMVNSLINACFSTHALCPSIFFPTGIELYKHVGHMKEGISSTSCWYCFS